MKSSFTILLLLAFTIFGNAQGAYGKISPGVMVPKNGAGFFAVFGSAGPVINQFIAFGASIGYYKMPNDSKPVVPLGGEIIFSEFKKDKVSPYAVIGVFYPQYENGIRGSLGSLTTISGVIMYRAGAGIALPVDKHKKAVLSGSFAPVTFKTKSSGAFGVPSMKTTTTQYFLSIEFIL